MEKKSHVLYSKSLNHEFSTMNVSLFFGLIIITLGLYIVYWIYDKNKQFEVLDDQSPDSSRGAVIMVILPFLWFFILYFLKGFIFGFDSVIVNFIGLGGWFFLIFMFVKYLLDFCLSFGRITQNQGVLPFLLFLVGFISGYLSLILNQFFIFLLIFPVFAVLFMQSELNLFYNSYRQRKDKKSFYH